MDRIFDELKECKLCPKNCCVDRYMSRGGCGAGKSIEAARAFLHKWEEPCISGERGSGTVFFTHCNLDCVFCQNYKISHGNHGKEISIDRLVEIFFNLATDGAHNINLVTPTHYIPQIREALKKSKNMGLKIPIIYNTNAYENVEALESLEGLVDIYLPDIKYYSDKLSVKYSKAPNYFVHAKRAIIEMYRQVGGVAFDEEGMMVKGLMIRHLMLPGALFDSKKVVDWVIDSLPREVYFNIMCQYTPLDRGRNFPELNKRLNEGHYESLLDYAISRGLENGFMQEFDSAKEEFVPEFDLQGI